MKIKDLLRALRKRVKSAKWSISNKTSKVEVDKYQIVSTLGDLGISKGDVVFVHSSLSALGYVIGGPKTVVEALVEVVGSEGTILMPSYPFRGSMYEYLSSKPEFNVMNDKSYMGAITETFRTLSKHRSLHPSHSVSAYGHNSYWYIKDHHKDDTPFEKNSPFFRAYDNSAKIVCIGSSIGHVTIYHIVEELVEFPKKVYLDKKFKVKVIDKDNNIHYVITKCHDPSSSKYRIDNDKDTCNYLHSVFSALNILKETQLGRGKVVVMNSKKLIDLLVWGSNRNLTIYGDLNGED